MKKGIVKWFAAFVVALTGLFAASAANAQNYSQQWFNVADNGEGLLCHQQTRTMFCVWFMYDEAGRGRFMVIADDLTRDAQQRDVLDSELFRAYSIQPMNYDPTRLRAQTGIGHGTVVFDSESSATFTFSFTNESGTLQTGTRKFAPAQFDRTGKLHYSNKVYALWDGGMPFAVTKAGATRVINKTHIPGIAPVVSCQLTDKPLENGYILTSCLDARNGVESTRAMYYINPVTEELNDYTGPVPVGFVFRTLSLDASAPQWYVKTNVADGLFYNSATDLWGLYFKSNATGTTTLVRSSQNNNLTMLMTYSN